MINPVSKKEQPMSNIIRSSNPTGFLAVGPSGNLVAIPSRLSDEEVKDGAKPSLKAGFRWATADDVAAATAAEAKRATAEAKLAAPTGGPLKGA